MTAPPRFAIVGRVNKGKSSIVATLAEGWEAPDKAALRLLRDLRRQLGPRRPITVLLAQVGASGVRPSLATDLRIWEETLAGLEDPYLVVEALRDSP